MYTQIKAGRCLRRNTLFWFQVGNGNCFLLWPQLNGQHFPFWPFLEAGGWKGRPSVVQMGRGVLWVQGWKVGLQSCDRWGVNPKTVTTRIVGRTKAKGPKYLCIRGQCCTEVPELALSKQIVLAPSSEWFGGNQELRVWKSLWDWTSSICSH